MKRITLIFAVLAVLLCSVDAEAALTYGAAYYRQYKYNVGAMTKEKDPLWLHFNEVDGLLGGTSSVPSILFTPGTQPTSTEGTLYYDSSSKGLKLRTNSAWVDVDVAGASSLNTSYGVGSKISAGTLEVEIEVADSSNNPALRLDFDDATTNAQDVLVIDNAGDDADAVSIQINGTAGDDLRGTGDAWNVSYLGVAGLVGATIGSTDLVFTEPTTNDVTLLADGDGILTISAGSMEDLDLNLATANTLTITSSTAVDKVNWGALDAHSGLNTLAFDVAVANSITQAGTGATDDLTIEQTASGVDASLILQSSGNGLDALSLISSVADIKVNSADNIDIDAADNITVDTAGGSYTLTTVGATVGDVSIVVGDVFAVASVDNMTFDLSAAGANFDVDSAAGSIYLDAGEAAANAIVITATAGSIDIDSADNIAIDTADDYGVTTADGGITLTAGGAANGDVTLVAGDALLLTTVGLKTFDGAAAETWIIEGTADDHEASIVFTDPTADVVYTFPVAAASTLSVMTSTLATNAPDIANSVTGGTSTLIFEGAAVDAHEHTITATDPTADIVWTLPDGAADTVAFMASTLATNYPEVVNSVTGGTATLIFEGTADDHETILGAVDATADATLTLANDTGGIAYIPTGSTTKDASNADLPLTHAVVIGTSGGASAWGLPDGSPGQVLTVVIGTDGGEAIITPASLTGSGWATAILTSDIDGITFMFVDATVGWIILGTYSDGTNLVAITQ